MIITITSNEKDYDIMTSPNNCILDTLHIMEESGMLSWGDTEPEYIYSQRKRKYVPTKLTYSENGIYQGDWLKLKDTSR